MKTEKHYFAGINANEGFVNHFSDINNSADGYTYILKGGPGTGKSTLMKTIGDYFQNMGEEVEYYHCSSDPDSLDGIYLKDRHIAIVDGTAPHVCEASIVICKEKIVNLGEYILNSVKRHRTNIEELLPKKQHEFDLAYDILRSAGYLYQTAEILSIPDTKNVLNEISNLVDMQPSTSYEEKRLFMSAVDYGGIYDLEPDNEYLRFITLTLSQSANHKIMEQLHATLKENHISHYTFGEILSPDKINSIYIVDDNILVKSEHLTDTPELRLISRETNRLVRMAGNHIRKARKIHKRIERYYRHHINFKQISTLTQNLIQEIQQTKRAT